MKSVVEKWGSLSEIRTCCKVDEPILAGHLKWTPTFEPQMVMHETENCFLYKLESQL
jgi:hypothetical protein